MFPERETGPSKTTRSLTNRWRDPTLTRTRRRKKEPSLHQSMTSTVQGSRSVFDESKQTLMLFMDSYNCSLSLQWWLLCFPLHGWFLLWGCVNTNTLTHTSCVLWTGTCHIQLTSFFQSRGLWLIVIDSTLQIIWVSSSFWVFFCVFEVFFPFFKQFYF